MSKKRKLTGVAVFWLAMTLAVGVGYYYAFNATVN